MIEALGYLSAVIVGLCLGLLGGGGSILTVPVLVYLMGITPVMTTAYSLFVVGFSSLAGSWRYSVKKQISYKVALVFGIPSIIAVYFTRRYLIPSIPDIIPMPGNLTLTRDLLIMIVFAALMIGSSVSMIRKEKIRETEKEELKKNNVLLGLQGTIIGVITGIVGAGGGFLIIPSLVIMGKLPMKTAVGTSLLIIAVKSLIGFIGDVENYTIDWIFLLKFSSFSVAGIMLGSYGSRFIDGARLKPAFGWFILILGMIIILNEFLPGF